MNETNDSLKSISKGAGILLLGAIIAKLFNYLYRVAVARFLTPSDYGLLSIGISVIGVALIMSFMGLPHALLRFVAYYRGKNDKHGIDSTISTCIKISMASSIAVMLLLLLLSKNIAEGIYNNPLLANILFIFALSLPFLVILYNIEIIAQAFMAIGYVVLARNIAEPLSKVVITLGLLFFGFGIAGAAIGYAIGSVIGSILLFYFLQKRVYSLFGALKSKIANTGPLFSFSLPLFLTDFAITAFVGIDTLMLGYFKTSETVGIYNAAAPTGVLVLIIPIALYTVFYPVICNLHARKLQIDNVYRAVSKWLFFVTLPVTLVLVLYSKEILALLFGVKYTSGFAALSIIAIGYLIHSLSLTPVRVMMMLNKTKLILVNKLVALFINITLNLVLIPKYGMEGAAFALAFSLFIDVILSHVEAYYFTKILPFGWNFFNAIFAGSVAAFIAHNIFNFLVIAKPPFFIVASGGFILIYGGILILMPHTIEDTDKVVLSAVYGKFKFKKGYI